MLLPWGEPFRELVGGSAPRVENPSIHRQIVSISPVNRHQLPDLHHLLSICWQHRPETVTKPRICRYAQRKSGLARPALVGPGQFPLHNSLNP
jgi:hypothetical protein